MSEQSAYLLAMVAVMVVAGAAVVLAPASAIAILGFGTLIETGLLNLLSQARAAVKVAEVAEQTHVAAVKVAEVAQAASAQDVKIDALARTATATHILVNSNYGASLMATLNALRAVEALTHDPAARETAHAAVVEAQRLYDDHIAKQAVVDAGPTPTVQQVEIVSTQTPVPVQVVETPKQGG